MGYLVLVFIIIAFWGCGGGSSTGGNEDVAGKDIIIRDIQIPTDSAVQDIQSDIESKDAITGDTGTQDAENRDVIDAEDVRDANVEDSEETDIYDVGDDIIGDLNPGPEFFDPVSVENIERAFSIAKDEASKRYSKYKIYFVEVQGNPTSKGNSYDEIGFLWGYAFTFCDASADPCNNFLGVQIDYPGWKSKIVESVAIGAYLAESEFFDTIKFNLRQILEKSGLGQERCPMEPGKSYIVLRGNINRGNNNMVLGIFLC
jgi:hypothetical protein